MASIDDIPLLVSRLNVDRVVVSLADARGKLPMDKLLDIRLESGVTFDHLASVYEEYTGKIAVENLRPSWLIFSEGFRKTRILLATKRAIDLVVSAVGAVLAAPIMLLVALAIRCTSQGPIFYHQRRVGLHGQVFTVHKFRTMKTDAERHTGPMWSTANDDRITSIGRSAAANQARRAAAAVERAARRDELRRSAARASGVRRASSRRRFRSTVSGTC